MGNITILHGVCTVQLTKGKNTLVDEADYPLASRFHWGASYDGYSFYADRTVYLGGGAKARRDRKEKLHRVLMSAPVGIHVDHRDGDTLNNTRSNMRLVTPAQNKRNRRRTHGASRFKGIWPMGGKWQAAIQVDRKRTHIGTFKTEEEAARAYDAAARELHGDFACTNVDLLGEY